MLTVPGWEEAQQDPKFAEVEQQKVDDVLSQANLEVERTTEVQQAAKDVLTASKLVSAFCVSCCVSV